LTAVRARRHWNASGTISAWVGSTPRRWKFEIKPRSATYGTVIRVSLRYHYPVITPVVRSLLGEKVLLEAKVISRSEKVR